MVHRRRNNHSDSPIVTKAYEFARSDTPIVTWLWGLSRPMVGSLKPSIIMGLRGCINGYFRQLPLWRSMKHVSDKLFILLCCSSWSLMGSYTHVVCEYQSLCYVIILVLAIILMIAMLFDHDTHQASTIHHNDGWPWTQLTVCAELADSAGNLPKVTRAVFFTALLLSAGGFLFDPFNPRAIVLLRKSTLETPIKLVVKTRVSSTIGGFFPSTNFHWFIQLVNSWSFLTDRPRAKQKFPAAAAGIDVIAVTIHWAFPELLHVWYIFAFIYLEMTQLCR